MTRLARTSLACVAMLAAASAFYALGTTSTSTAQEPKGKFAAAPRPPWEYKVFRMQGHPALQDKEIEKELNDAGAEGWEAVGPVSVVSGSNGRVETYSSYILKRRK